MTNEYLERVRFFYGLQPRWLSWDRLYRIYVSDKMLTGAYIAGQLYDEQSAALQLQQANLFLWPLVRCRLARREERERLYDTVYPFSPEILDYDARNFQMPRSDVVWTQFRRNRSLWAAFNVGSVEFECLDGTRRRFILVGNQQPEQVLQLLQEFDSAIELTGKPARLLNPVSSADKRFPSAFVGLMLLCLGGIFAFAALAGLGRNPFAYYILAIFNAGLGAWCLVRAWRDSAARSPNVESVETKKEGERIDEAYPMGD